MTKSYKQLNIIFKWALLRTHTHKQAFLPIVYIYTALCIYVSMSALKYKHKGMIVHLFARICVCIHHCIYANIHNLTIRQKSILIALKMIPFASLNVILFVCCLRFLFVYLFCSFFSMSFVRRQIQIR